jgi:hypothetical protein
MMRCIRCSRGHIGATQGWYGYLQTEFLPLRGPNARMRPGARYSGMGSAWSHRISPSMVRTVVWTLRARRRARQAVSGDGIRGPIELPDAANEPLHATSAVVATLARTRATCLVRSLVLQRWFADHGEPVDLIIGVTPPSAGFRAHAWLDRPGEVGMDGYTELHRLSPPQSGPVGDRAA